MKLSVKFLVASAVCLQVGAMAATIARGLPYTNSWEVFFGVNAAAFFLVAFVTGIFGLASIKEGA